MLCFAVAALCFSTAISFANDKALAQVDTQITANYEVYASGFRTLAAQANIREGREDYASYVTIETDGLLRALAPWQGILSSTGIFYGEEYTRRPSLHAFDSIWRGSNKRVEQHYTEQGTLKEVVIKEDDRADEIKAPDLALVEGSTDILSAALEASKQIQTTQSCTSDHAVYDGKRRFILSFKEVKRENFKASRYNSYGGEAIKCIVEITPDGGKWREKKRGWMSIQEQSKEKGHPPYIWFGEVSAETNDGELVKAYIPVKLQVKTSYGTLMLHIKSSDMRVIDKSMIATQ